MKWLNDQLLVKSWPSRTPRTTSFARKAYCYGGYKRQAVSKPEASQSSLPHSIRAIRRLVKFASSPHKGSIWSFSEEDRGVIHVQEARISHHDRLRAIATGASNSPFSEGIKEYEFFKKFMILTFDWYSGQSYIRFSASANIITRL